VSKSHVLLEKGLMHLDRILLSDARLDCLERAALRTNYQVVQQAKVCLNMYEYYGNTESLDDAAVLCLLLLQKEVATSEQDRLRKRITAKGIEARKEQVRKKKGT